jgi:MFS transporter, OPA family, glycerol-3-phosphate transporter
VIWAAPLALGIAAVALILSVIGVHGLLSGTATMDFGGRKGAATAVGIIDGFVYLGTGFQSLCLGYLTTKSWSFWPPFLLPFAIIGFVLCIRIWKAMPNATRKSKTAH